MASQLFLDSNSYLGMYSLSGKDIEQLQRFAELVEMGKIKLLLPTQVIDEVRRNRARVVADRLKALEDARINAPIPQMATDFETSKKLKAALAAAHQAHAELVGELREKAQTKELPADLLLERLFKAAEVLTDASAVDRASQRKALGNPPGKGNSLGDGVNWEILLSQCPNDRDLHLVSADGDFSSPLDQSMFDDFLGEEWTWRKDSQISYYRDIKQFLDVKFPQIRLASDVRKYFLIESLIESGSFLETHNIVAQLISYGSFTVDEATRLLTGALENNQVRWLARDEDVKQLLHLAIRPHRNALPKSLVDKWDYLIAGRGLAYGPVPTPEDIAAPDPEPVDDDDLPF